MCTAFGTSNYTNRFLLHDIKWIYITRICVAPNQAAVRYEWQNNRMKNISIFKCAECVPSNKGCNTAKHVNTEHLYVYLSFIIL